MFGECRWVSGVPEQHVTNPIFMFLNFWHFLFVWFTSVHPKKKNRQTCVRKSLICAFAMAFIISVMLIAANQMLRNGMEWPLALWAGGAGGGGQNSHDLTFSHLCSQRWTNHNPDTSRNDQLSLSSLAVFYFCSFLNYLYSISVFIYIISNYLVDGDGQCVKRKKYVCFELAKVTGEKENGVFIYK